MIKKIKIRDMTEEQRDKICKSHNLTQHGWAYCGQCPFCAKALDGEHCCLKRIAVSFLSNDFLNKEVEVEVPDILTKEEKEWLENLANGVDDRPTLVTISTRMRGTRQIIISFMHDSLSLPVKQDWFKGMEENRCYNMKELGL
jgi:hypothetical protein